jgi:hypothetical protein
MYFIVRPVARPFENLTGEPEMLKHVREAIRMSGVPLSAINHTVHNGHIHLWVYGHLVVCGSSPSDKDVAAKVTAKKIKFVANQHNLH